MPTTLIGLRHLIALFLLRCLYPQTMRQAQAAVVLPLPARSQSETDIACRWTLLSLARPIEIAPTHRAQQILSHGQWQEPAIFLLPKRSPSTHSHTDELVSPVPHDANGFTLNAALLGGGRDTPTELTLCCERLLEIEREIARHDRIAAIEARVRVDGKFVRIPPSPEAVALGRSLRAAAIDSLKQVSGTIQQIVATQFIPEKLC